MWIPAGDEALLFIMGTWANLQQTMRRGRERGDIILNRVVSMIDLGRTESE